MEFFTEWKKLGSNSAEKYNVLLRIGGPTLAKVFKIEIGYGLLGDFLQVLLKHFDSDDSLTIAEILTEFTATGNFGLSLMFLNSEEKNCCDQLMSLLQESSLDSKLIHSLQQKYNA